MPKENGVTQRGLGRELLGPELKININASGEWSVTETTRVDLIRSLPILKTPMGTRHKEYGWLRLDEIDANLEEGEVLAVSSKYMGKIQEGQDPDEPDGDATFPKTQLRITTSDEPLLTHVRYDELDAEERKNLARILAGSDDEDLESLITSDLGREALIKINKGIVAYRDPKVEFVRSYTSNTPLSDLNNIGKIDNNPDDAPTVSAGRSWLFSGANQDHQSTTYDIQLVWELSGRGGWDPDLYN